jgi:ABC-type antimicrobial peptide transport system permease subunit
MLATIGLYGILSYAVASRTNEIGIRIALGASTRGVVKLVLREALTLVVIGVVAGLPALFIVARFAEAMLFDLSATDPLSLFIAGVMMLVVAIIAAYLPARRAMRIDPLVALRYE